MAYTAAIDRSNPACFVFVVDQSGSMQDKMSGGDSEQRKCDIVADALNRLLAELTLRCAKEEGVRDYFHVGVIGYGTRTGAILGGALSGRELVPISEIASSPQRIDERTKKVPDGAGGLVEQSVKFPIWVTPTGDGGTPMCAALGQVQAIVSGWIGSHPDCFPPIVLHLTDGESTDGDPSAIAENIRSISSSDGNTLLFNLHISSDRSTPLTFPASEEGLPNDFARLLFRMSSRLPDSMASYARQQEFSIAEGSRGFVFNADATSIVQFMDIGTRASELR